MRKMIATLLASYRIVFAMNVNRAIFYFKRLPLVGKLLPDRIYGEGGLKVAATIIFTIITVIRKFIGKGLYLGLMILLPIDFLLKGNQGLTEQAFIQIFLCLSFLAGTIPISGLLDSNQNKYVCIKLMHFPSREYAVSTMLAKHITEFLFFLPAVMICFWAAGGRPWNGFLISIMLLAFRFFNEGIHLLLFEKTGFIISQKYWILFTVIIISLVGAYLPVYLKLILPWDQFLFSLPIIVILFLGATFSLYFIFRYQFFKKAIMSTIQLDEMTMDKDKLKADMRFKAVEMKEEDFSKEGLKDKKFEQKQGYEYLNSIFFERHRKLLEKPIVIRLCIIGAVFLAFVIASFFFPSITENMGKQLTQMLPSIVFVMYFTSIGDKICKAMFCNCDISLLRYGFYRKPDVILKNFVVRLKKITGLNLILGGAICLGLVLLTLISGSKVALLDVILFIVSVLCLAVFFSVHHLFLYYVFQPYTTELGVKNPFFVTINAIVYLVCYGCMQLRNVPEFFTIAVIAATILYIIIALTLVYRLAPKNFKVK